jgi:hypothetical protein
MEAAEQEQILAEQAARAAADEAEAPQPLPPGTVRAQTAFLVYLRPDGAWVAESKMMPLALEREAHNGDMLAGCAAISATVISDITAGQVLAQLSGMGAALQAQRVRGNPNGVPPRY